jgi:hypothetical protein
MSVYSKRALLRLRAMRDARLKRMDLRFAPDGFARRAPAGATAPMLKVTDPATKALIEATLTRPK